MEQEKINKRIQDLIYKSEKMMSTSVEFIGTDIKVVMNEEDKKVLLDFVCLCTDLERAYNKEKEKNKELEYSLKNNVVTKYCIRHKADDYESKGYIEIASAMRELLEERN